MFLGVFGACEVIRPDNVATGEFLSSTLKQFAALADVEITKSARRMASFFMLPSVMDRPAG
jgi:hypothetical protein